MLDHAVKARDAVLDHDAQLAAWRERERAIRERAAERRRKAKEEAKARAKETGLSARRLMPKVLGDAEGEEAGEEPEHRDQVRGRRRACRAALASRAPLTLRGRCCSQGFTRPRVLVLLPVRSAAERFVRDMLQLLPPSYVRLPRVAGRVRHGATLLTCARRCRAGGAQPRAVLLRVRRARGGQRGGGGGAHGASVGAVARAVWRQQ